MNSSPPATPDGDGQAKPATSTPQAATSHGSAHRSVVYLLGTGASHACAEVLGSTNGLLMANLKEEIAERTRAVAGGTDRSPSVQRIANEVIQDADIEHVITFLEGSGTAEHQWLSSQLRQVFETVLRGRLRAIETELSQTPAGLYAALVDMYAVPGVNETLRGFLTLNYDGYLEHAVEQLGFAVDYGIADSSPSSALGREPIRVLKLHGSFTWRSVWPIELDKAAEQPLWIPPGIQKQKGLYPFNILWGRARELLDCDVLRIIGCNLGPNDWDLVSMLFSAQHAHRDRPPYEIEIVDRVKSAERIKAAFPYLRAKSLLEVDGLGPQLIAELTSGETRRLGALADHEQGRLLQADLPSNPFWHWLKLRAEGMFEELGTVETPKRMFAKLLES